eukprot:scaffold3218_cov350-Prasinococcus_capsulatus_cf.AAC.10
MLPTLELRMTPGLALARVVGPTLEPLPSSQERGGGVRGKASLAFALRSAQVHEGLALFLDVTEDTRAPSAAIQVTLRYHTVEGTARSQPRRSEGNGRRRDTAKLLAEVGVAAGPLRKGWRSRESCSRRRDARDDQPRALHRPGGALPRRDRRRSGGGARGETHGGGGS